MHLTITSASSDAVFPLEVPDDLDIANLKAFCQAHSDIPAEEMVVIFNGKTLDDEKKSVAECGIKDGEMLLIDRKKKKKQAASPAGAFGGLDFSQIRLPGKPALGLLA